MKTITLNVSGMHCGGCVKSVTKVLNELAGVQHTDVALSGSATIEFDETQVSVSQLIEAIEDAGFDAAE